MMWALWLCRFGPLTCETRRCAVWSRVRAHRRAQVPRRAAPAYPPRRPAAPARRARVVSRRHTGELNYDEYASFYNTDRTRVRAYLITPVPGEHESRDTTSTRPLRYHRYFYAIRHDPAGDPRRTLHVIACVRADPAADREGDIWRNIIRHYTIV